MSAPAFAGGAPIALERLPAEAATSSDAFVDTIGFNAHIENKYSVYARSFPQVKALLVGAGIRHVRVGMVFGNSQYYSDMKDLAAAGIHGLYVTQATFTQQQIQQYPRLVAPSFEGYENPNEPDKVADPDWAAHTRAFAQSLYSWVKGDAQTSRYDVVGPSVTNKFAELGDISASIDYANIHNYLDVFNPDTIGYGGKTPYGVYGSINYNVNIVKQISAAKPVISTETGYGATVDGALTSSGRPTLDYRAQLRYIPRLFLEQFRHHIVRTYCYEFLDEGGQGTFDHFGVVEHDLTPKPAYVALKAIISALSDPGPGFVPTPLPLEVTGDTANVQHIVLQKRTGQYEIPIWLEVQSWKPHGGGDITVPDQRVTISTGNSIHHAAISVMDESGVFTKHDLALNDGQTSFAVNDKVSILTLSP